MTYRITSVADKILQLAKAQKRGLTPLQLMKLAYISFGWYIANFETRLFAERIEAWRYGPVMPRLYRITKVWGRNPIPLDKISDQPNSIDERGSEILGLVFNAYGHLSGIQLSSLTHQDGSPWHKVYRDGVPDIEIPEHLIYEHYKGMLDAANSSTGS